MTINYDQMTLYASSRFSQDFMTIKLGDLKYVRCKWATLGSPLKNVREIGSLVQRLINKSNGLEQGSANFFYKHH